MSFLSARLQLRKMYLSLLTAIFDGRIVQSAASILGANADAYRRGGAGGPGDEGDEEEGRCAGHGRVVYYVLACWVLFLLGVV